jgi:hypothetical protein
VAILIGSYLALVFMLPLALSAVVSYRALPSGRHCPRCDSETLQLLTPWRRVSGRVRFLAQLQRRWCMDCGWEGSARVRAESPRTPLRARVIPDRDPHQDPTPVRRSTQTLDVRSLEVDGTPWRVMIQCWGNTGVFYGRLVFVAPTGRLWLDGVQSFSGSDQRDVLGQAQSLPEGLLEHRLRRLVTEF